MNKKQQQLFVAFFEELFQSEESFEIIKKNLSKSPYYNPYQLFRQIAATDGYDNNSQAITIERFRDYLVDRIACNQRQLYELFEKLDINRNGFISIKDFVTQLTPLDERVQQQRSPGKVTAEIQGQFLSLLTQYLKRFRIIQVLRKDVDFIWPYNAFIQIDNYKTGLIGLGQLERFMQRNDYRISEYQLMLLLHGLRRRCYLQVNLEVFCENLNPLQFGQYENYKNNIEQSKEKEFLNRSRVQQETMRRSRIQSWKVQHSIAKEERRRKAEKERQLELQQRINNEIKQQEKQKQRYLRRAILQQDKNIRWNIHSGNHVLQAEKERQIVEKLKNQDLGIVRNQESDVKNVLIKTALEREDYLDESRKARYNLERSRQIQQELQYQKQLQRRQYELYRERLAQQEYDKRELAKEKQRIAQEEYQRQREIQIKQEILKEKRLRGERERQNYKQTFISEVQASRRIYQQELRIERERAQRAYELQRIRNQDVSNLRSYQQPTSNSRRLSELERQLERTRAEIRDRQSRLNLTGSKRVPQTADREYRGGYR